MRSTICSFDVSAIGEYSRSASLVPLPDFFFFFVAVDVDFFFALFALFDDDEARFRFVPDVAVLAFFADFLADVFEDGAFFFFFAAAFFGVDVGFGDFFAFAFAAARSIACFFSSASGTSSSLESSSDIVPSREVYNNPIRKI